MRRLFALILAISLWFGFAAAAPALAQVQGNSSVLVPCKDSPAFQQRYKDVRPSTDDRDSGRKRLDRYSEALCGPEGLPHLIVDGSLNHAGDFLIPSILFLYIAGWIGWVGRAYIQAVKKDKDPEQKEIVIDVPLAISKMATGPLWPLLALQEFLSGKMFADETEIPVSPR